MSSLVSLESGTYHFPPPPAVKLLNRRSARADLTVGVSSWWLGL